MWFASLDAHRKWDEQKGLTNPHGPADAVIPPYMVDASGVRGDLARYYDEIARLDRYTGLVVEELKRQNVYKNTLICFMADNGRPFPRCKTWLYDSGIKTPLIMTWPQGLKKADAACASLVSVIDLAPTFLDLAGVARPEAMQGVSLYPLLQDARASVRDYVFAEHNWHDMEAHERMVRWKHHKYIRNARPELANWVYAHHAEPSYVDLFERQRAGKLTPAQADVLRAPRPAEMFFDLETDPEELHNLVDEPQREGPLVRLRKALDEWQERTGDTVPENLTGDIIDRETYGWLHKPKEVPRGTIPGSERGAEQINDPGPR
jgi:arylsulfatase A-like enzyme